MIADSHASNSKPSHWLLMGVTGIVLLAVVVGTLVLLENPATVRPVSVREERAAAESLLANKLSGPGYFNIPAETASDDGVIWIDADDALRQMPRIVAERKLTSGGERSLGLLIEKLIEPHPCRMRGGKRINLSRLNLSLDAIK
jgi:hypothetical protein